jgi:hypothetical protein
LLAVESLAVHLDDSPRTFSRSSISHNQDRQQLKKVGRETNCFKRKLRFILGTYARLTLDNIERHGEQTMNCSFSLSNNDARGGVTIEGSRLKERCYWRNKRKGFLEEMM